MQVEIPYRRVLMVFLVLFLAISADLVFLQATPEAEALTTSAYNPRHCVRDETPQRGTIYDRTGVPLAWSVPDDTSPCGWRRHYTDPSLAPLIGYYDPQGFGVTGLEAAYDDLLSGNTSKSVAPGIRNGLQDLLNKAEHLKTYGSDIYLTIDERIQAKAVALYGADLLQRGKNEPPGSILVEDPHTGELLAYVSYPGYNNDTLVDHTDAGDGTGLTVGQEYWNQLLQDPNKPLINRPVADILPPGSVFKTLTLITALESGMDVHNTTFDQADALSYTVDGFPITSNNLDAYTHGPKPPSFPLNLVDAYAYSDNVVFARLATMVGKQTYLQKAGQFGLSYGSTVNDIPFDIPVAHSWVYLPQQQQTWDRDNVDFATVGFGEGTLLVTPLQDAVITSAVAADGAYYAPHLLWKVVPHGVDVASVKPTAPHLQGQVMSQTTAVGVRDAMRAVVQYGSIGASGSAFAPPPNSPVMEGAKTGTAQTGINNTQPHATIISLAPDDTANPTTNPPKLVIIVNKEFAGEAAYQAPITESLYEYALPLVDPQFPNG